MAPQPTDQTHLRQYFEHLAGNSTVMHALQIGADVGEDLLALEINQALQILHLKSLTTKNAGLVPGSLHQALEVYFLQCHRRKNAARSEKRTIARVLGLHATPLSAKSLADTGTVRMVTRDHSAKTSYKRGTLLVDRGNEDLVGSGDTALSVPVDDLWYVIEPDESIIFVDSKDMNNLSVSYMWLIGCIGSVTLAVLHGKCGQRPDLLTYVNSIIDEAVNDRKGTRVTYLLRRVSRADWDDLTATITTVISRAESPRSAPTEEQELRTFTEVNDDSELQAEGVSSPSEGTDLMSSR
ncbi:uncharacterized protein F5891DRAFT_1184104 [Suillus fuscotomentosus]|uniref:Uncharacterized protein n=1 Tax=Suillus fuscotomentosus TaxID=1912939 RepID=A0AAD4HQB7_9AGAM|nr:uncharacterized protein F5891DRAFT_1184104 [Suillus fuscotomentosus]KAG1904691.1 hypothetical protein F5891DRAFT_1184104 [Suillus fuscotomentosus]